MGFVMRDFGRLRVLLYRKPYGVVGFPNPMRVYVTSWRGNGDDDSRWEVRLLWLELRWSVHRGD